MTAWARTDGALPAPRVDAARRNELTMRLVAAQHEAVAARHAGAAIEHDLAGVSAEAAALAVQIEAAALDGLAVRFVDELAALQVEAGRFQSRLAGVLACLEFIRAAAENKQSQGQIDVARGLFTRHAQLAQGISIDIQPSLREVTANVPKWSGLYAELMR